VIGVDLSSLDLLCRLVFGRSSFWGIDFESHFLRHYALYIRMVSLFDIKPIEKATKHDDDFACHVEIQLVQAGETRAIVAVRSTPRS